MKTPFLSSFRRPSGFTLLEMVITMVIFLLLAGAVFGIITSVLESTSTLHDNQDRHDQVAALNAYLKKKLGDLPAQSSLLSYQRDGEGLPQNGIVVSQNDTAIAIDAKLQPNGYYTLRLTTLGDPDRTLDGGVTAFLTKTVKEDWSQLKWTPLIHDVKTLHWKFQNMDANQWVDVWTEPNTKPNIVEFSMQIAGDLQPVTMDFWLPRLSPPILAIAPAAPGAPPVPPNGPAPAPPSPPGNSHGP